MDILVPYDSRKTILSSLSAFDIAKLDLALGHILDKTESRTYLNPVRDIIWNTSEMSDLIIEGMRLILCGNDVPLLRRRLHDTQQYIKAYGHERRLQIYLIGVFPFRRDDKNIHDRMLSFSISKVPCNDRISKDKQELNAKLRVLQNSSFSSKAPFLLSFGTTVMERIGRGSSTWHLEPDIPDKTIDLWVYVPSYHDRFIEEIVLPPSVIPGLFGFAYRKTWILQLLIAYSKIAKNKIGLHASYLNLSGLQDSHDTWIEGTLYFSFSPSLFIREFPL